MKKTLYDILEVSEKASKEVIEKAYRVLAKKYHPDLQTDENKIKAESKMKEINEAYNVLSDELSREKYDEKLASDREREKQEELEKQQEIYTNLNNNIYNSKNNSQMYSQGNINNKNLQHSMQEALKKEQENLIMQREAYAKRQAEMEQEYNNAYYKYLKSLGYKVKFKWTWKQYVMLFIIIAILIVIGLILWVIPPTHDWMLNLYNDNIFIKTIVNIFIGIFNGIGKMISGIFNNS